MTLRKTAVWTNAVLCVLCVAATFAIRLPMANSGDTVGDYINTVGVLAFPVLGALIATRVPSNRLGPMLCAIGFWVSPGTLFGTFGDIAINGGAVPAAVVWLAGWWVLPAVGLLALVLLHFPDGRLPSRRWRPLQVVIVAATATLTGSAWFGSPLGDDIPSPLSVKPLETIFGPLDAPSFVVIVGAAAVATVSVFLRLRRATGDERQQIKIFAYAAAVLVAMVSVTLVAGAIGNVPEIAGDLLATAAVLSVPLAISVAILRYRLYDIDRVISRTLSYAVVTALLAGVYAALAVGLGTVARGSSLTVAVATLAVAALFRPVRGRVQRIVDRRFNRTRYDAALTVERFARRLRDEMDLTGLAAGLGGAAREAMRPRSLSLWLREPTR